MEDESMYLIGGLLLLVLGALMILVPEGIYEMTQSWKHDTPSTPSKAYIISTRFGGGMVTIVGIAAIVGQFLI